MKELTIRVNDKEYSCEPTLEALKRTLLMVERLHFGFGLDMGFLKDNVNRVKIISQEMSMESGFMFDEVGSIEGENAQELFFEMREDSVALLPSYMKEMYEKIREEVSH